MPLSIRKTKHKGKIFSGKKFQAKCLCLWKGKPFNYQFQSYDDLREHYRKVGMLNRFEKDSTRFDSKYLKFYKIP